MSANPYRALARAVEDGLLPPLVLEEHVEHVEHLGRLHHPPCWTLPVEERGALDVLPRTTSSARSVAEERTCPCLHDVQGDLLNQAALLVEVRDAAVRAHRAATEHQRGRLEGARRELGVLREQLTSVVDPLLSDGLNAVEERLDDLGTAIELTFHGEQLRDALLERARYSLTRDRPMTLDDQPMVVGLLVDPRSLPKALIELCEAFSVHLGRDHAVLTMPRYVYDFLQRELMRTNQVHALSVAHATSHGRDVLDAAAVLWDPDGSGPSRDLGVALELAGALDA